MKSAKLKDLIPPSKYNQDTLFTMIFIKEKKSRQLGPQEVGKSMASMSFDKFLDYFNYTEEDAV